MRRAPRRRPPPLQRHPGHRVAQLVRVSWTPEMRQVAKVEPCP
jgi:hypothetical protein